MERYVKFVAVLSTFFSLIRLTRLILAMGVACLDIEFASRIINVNSFHEIFCLSLNRLIIKLHSLMRSSNRLESFN